MTEEGLWIKRLWPVFKYSHNIFQKRMRKPQ